VDDRDRQKSPEEPGSLARELKLLKKITKKRSSHAAGRRRDAGTSGEMWDA